MRSKKHGGEKCVALYVVYKYIGVMFVYLIDLLISLNVIISFVSLRNIDEFVEML